MTPDLQTTNTWLAILAVAGALQTLLLLAAAVGLFRIYRSTVSALDALEAAAPGAASARAPRSSWTTCRTSPRARAASTTRCGRSCRGWTRAATVAKDVVSDRIWPVVGVARAVSAGLRAFTNRTPHNPVSGGRLTAHCRADCDPHNTSRRSQ